MRRKLLPLILGGLLSVAAVAPTAAQTECDVQNAGGGGAAALIALVNVNAVVPVGANVCDVDVLNNSLNNLLRNADIDVLSNILNNSPILNNSLNDLTITVQDVIDGGVLSGIQVNVLSGGIVVDSITFNLPQ